MTFIHDRRNLRAKEIRKFLGLNNFWNFNAVEWERRRYFFSVNIFGNDDLELISFIDFTFNFRQNFNTFFYFSSPEK